MSKIKVDQLETLDGSVTVNVSALASAGSGVTDHGGLTGLADDDHPQYLNNARGDARYSQLGHTHAVGDVTGLQTALDGKAAATHTHAVGDVTGLQTALDGKAAATHTHAVGDVTGLQTALDGKAAATHTHAVGDVTGLQTALDGKQATLVSGTNIKTINGQSLLGGGDITITGGNAATATRLQTARTINGTSFDGSANITTANWGTARTLTIGNTGKALDGSADVSWSLAEIGVTAFGLGDAAAGVPGNNIDNNAIPTGFYYVTATTSGTKPAGDDGFGHLIVSREGNGITARQLYLDNQGNRISTRVYVDTAWSGWLDISPTFTSYTIVGLVQVATGGGAGTYVRIGEDFVPKTTDAAFFNNHPTYSGIVTQTIDGQQMVRIPKFWFKAGTVPSGTYAGKAYWMISDQPAPGFSVHPAFIGAGGVELDQIWVGKYQASASGGKLQSVAGVAPRVSMNFSAARAEAYARNTGGVSGFRLWSYYDLAAIQMLASIEMGGLDMQALIGQGRVIQSSSANVDASDVAQATWRGIVGLWGNVWQMVDGLKRNGGNWWRWQYNAPGNTITSDLATGYINTGRAALTTAGFPVTFDTTLLSAGIIVPATVNGAASNGSTGDYFWSDTNTGDRIAYNGGNWGYGAGAGLFCLDVGSAPSDAHSHFGARLAKV